jgi:hypothetical protein
LIYGEREMIAECPVLLVIIKSRERGEIKQTETHRERLRMYRYKNREI